MSTNSEDSLRDIQSIVRSIVVGLKTVIWCVTSYRPNKEEEPVKITAWELDLIDKFILYSLPCMKVFSDSESQYRDVLTYFGASFTVLDTFNFRQTIGRRINVLVDATVEDQQFMVVARHLLGSKMSYEYTHLLLSHLMEYLADLGVAPHHDFVFVKTPIKYWDLAEVEKAEQRARETILDMKEDTDEVKAERKGRSLAILELFERILKSLGTHPENEVALRPHLRNVVSSCLRTSMETFCGDWPDKYCILLRCIFRSISGGKFEESYKELLPLIPTILNGLNRIFHSTDDISLRHTIIELCLTIPARLSSLLPHMSLLLQMIIPALRSANGDLVNLGLRTLEFWIDNLNPEFLYPILSNQSVVFVDLMASLSTHLQPAPYPYGLLTLRLMGKLGGKNRRFLREPFEQQPAYSDLRRQLDILAIDCVWEEGNRNITQDNTEHTSSREHEEPVLNDEETVPKSFKVLLPLERAVEVLALIASAPLMDGFDEDNKETHDAEFKTELIQMKWADYNQLSKLEPDTIDIRAYCDDVVEQTKSSQARAAFTIISSSLAQIINVLDFGPLRSSSGASSPHSLEVKIEKVEPVFEGNNAPVVSRGSLSIPSIRLQKEDLSLKLIIRGLIIGSSIVSIQEDCCMLLKGLSSHFLFIAVTHGAYIHRIDSNGCRIPNRPTSVDITAENRENEERIPGETSDSQQKSSSCAPFGYFEFSGPLQGKVDLFSLNEAIGEYLRSPTPSCDKVLPMLISHLLETFNELKKNDPTNVLSSGADAFFENLLCVFCNLCASLTWNRASTSYDGLCALIGGLGMNWSKRYELEIMHAAILAVKKCPKEIPYAGVKSFQLFADICSKIYGEPSKWTDIDDDSTLMIRDPLHLPNEKKTTSSSATENLNNNIRTGDEATSQTQCPSEEVLHVLINELSSISHIVRIAIRFALKNYVLETMSNPKDCFVSKLPFMKRLLFTRSLRLLPLPEQIGVIEALAFVIDCIPGLISISDQQLLGFLSEFLKMGSIVDGEMTDSSIVAQFVDKNGFATSTQGDSSASGTLLPNILPLQASGLFFRQECIVRIGNKRVYAILPQELPHGIQLRVTALRMFRAVIRRHADDFFDAESSTPIGNIRPHVISLLFRSLVSSPTQAVTTAHEALLDVLSLSVMQKEETEPGKSQSRLPKELLQTCIRPVLLNLRDYTRLSVPLLRGLSKLLSLLSSWFNTTLGEKLLEHLTKWTDPDRIITKMIWHEGQEPIVAAAIMDLFALLPHASHFVEPLVKTAIKLEAVLPRFKFESVTSPYLGPLSRYLNKHCSGTVAFFFHRLKNPMYSELFHEIILHEDSSILRKHLSGRQCSVTLLNVCFERPLAIIRSEKVSPGQNGLASTPKKSADMLVMHGVSEEVTGGKQNEGLRRDIEVKQKSLTLLQQEATRTKEALQARLSSTTSTSAALDEAKRNHKTAQSAVDRGQKDLTACKQRYAAGVAQPKDFDVGNVSPRRMSSEALELQLQGFRLTESLISKDLNYLKEHNDVIRAFRWLWRSKGRHLRLQHEEAMSPRFHQESKQLASFLVSYATTFPNDVDVLFELLRIFLQPSTTDFNFVKEFLVETVSKVLSYERKKHVVQRFFALLAGEGPEETKVLSIQLILFPMIKSLIYEGIIETENEVQNTETAEDVYISSTTGGVKDSKGMTETRELTKADVFESLMISKFIREVLFKDGSPANHGDRLRVEFLRLSMLLLEYAPTAIECHRKEVIKFSWVLLKSDDLNCKNWAYLTLCRFVAAFETPANIVMQIYVALLRAYQHESREIVKASVAILVPSLQERFNKFEFNEAIQYTNKILYEEGNSVPHVAHIWQIIAAHSEVFRSHRNQFIRHIINSVNRLGLPPSCPIENRALSLRLTELVLEWQEDQHNSLPTEVDAHLDSGEKSAITEENPPETLEQNILASDKGPDHIDTLANFLVRLKILLADAKIEGNPQNLDSKTTELLSRVIRRWNRCNIRPMYFEKVVSMCRDDTATPRRVDGSFDIPEKRGKDKGKSKTSAKSLGKFGKSATSKSSQASISREDPKTVQTTLLLACLDIFIVLVENEPCHLFLSENSGVIKDILEPCFSRASSRDGKLLRQKIRSFLVPALTTTSTMMDKEFHYRINALLESFIVESTLEASTSLSSSELSKSPDSSSENPFSSDDTKMGGSCLALFSLDLIETVSKISPSFAETFTGTIVGLAEKLAKRHSTISPNNVRQATLSNQGGNSKHISPTAAIINFWSTSIGTAGRKEEIESKSPSRQDGGQFLAVDRYVGTSIRSLVICLRLAGSSKLPFIFSSERQTFFHLLGSILESCNSVHIVLAAVRLVGNWLLMENGRSPLTAKEKASFLWKLSSIDCNTLPPVVSQPVADLVASYLAPKILSRSLSFNKLRIDCGDLPARLLVASLLHANENIRREILASYIASMNFIDEGVGETSKIGITFQLLWNLLHSDFEGLGRRLWTIVFTDVLLECASPRLATHTDSGWLPPPSVEWSPSAQASIESSCPEYFHFLSFVTETRKNSEGNAKRCLDATRSLAHGDELLSQSLFETLISSSWKALIDNEQRLSLVVPIEHLIARPYHAQHLKRTSTSGSAKTTNALQCWARAISILDPLPMFDVDLLVSLAVSYNIWHTVLDILTTQYEVASLNTGFKDEHLICSRLRQGIVACLGELGEESLKLGVVTLSCKLPQTIWAISLHQQGPINDSLIAYENLMILAEKIEESNGPRAPTSFEMDLWETQWIKLQREMCQVGVVSEFANTTENYKMMLECACQAHQWDKVKDLCVSPPLIALSENGDPSVKMSEILVAISENKLTDIENLHAQTAQLALNQWQLLPSMAPGSPAHSSLLHFFHRLVELRESGQIMVETTNHSNRKTFPDLKNLLSAWRHRLPNDHDAISLWDEIFLWRLHMFSAIASHFSWSEPSMLASLHDRPWTSIQMARVARKQGLREVALQSLNQLTDCSMDVSDAFSKLREQILAYCNPDSDLERTGGLNMINNTNLSFFDSSQKSELFRLKAIFLSSLGGRSKSNQSFCHAVQICPSYARAWVSWGGLCASLGKLAEKQSVSDSSTSKPGSDLGDLTNSKKVAQYLAQGMGCYLEAIQCDPIDWARIHLSKCLWMLSKDGSEPGVLCQTFESRGTVLPEWVWLPWIPQLLTSLYRTEGKATKAILNGLVKSHPQALYFPLRAFYLERRDVERNRGPLATGHLISVANSEELMSSLRRAHASLWSSLEAILEELIVKFRPSYEEELLATITALLERAESQTDHYIHTERRESAGDDEEAIVASVSKTLARISAKFFRDIPVTPSCKRDERTKRTIEFSSKYKAMFQHDFLEKDVDGIDAKLPLAEFLTRLKKWRFLLATQVASTPLSLPLVESSPSLALFTADSPDLWPMSCDPHPTTVSTLEIDRASETENSHLSSTSSSVLAAKAAFSVAALAVAKAAEREGCGGEYGGGSSSIEIPGQYAPNVTSSIDSKPSPELHPKLVSFEAVVNVIRRNEQLVRRIGMIGSDGRRYRFLLQFAIPYWTRTDERTTQIHYILDKVLRKDIMSSRKFLALQPTPVIPIAQRLRMTAEDDNRMSLDDVFRKVCDESGQPFDAVSQSFHNEIVNELEAKNFRELGREEKAKLEVSLKLKAYDRICSTMVDSSMLLDFIRSTLGDAERVFHFRRSFAGQLAISSMLQHAFCVAERTPSRIVFNERTGQVFAPDFRFSYNNQGFLDEQRVPFRLTRNLRELIGSIFEAGRFVPAMATFATAVKNHLEDIDPVLKLLMRDDIIAWYTSKSMAKSDAKTQELEKQLHDRVLKNVSQVQIRMVECSFRRPPKDLTPEKLPKDPVDKKVRSLVEEATNREKLCQMLPNYQPWL